jgi:TolB-like protein/DNA-binding winged helix-turn-helix (wHTH) protein/Flp pilus assembly protein TadD
MSTLDLPLSYQFGRFVLEPGHRSLRAGADIVPLGARAFDILLLLVRHRDRVVSKHEILVEVWRGTIVEENNLSVHVSSLRRALGERPGGDRFIATVAGLGYRFVASVSESETAPVAPAAAPVPAPKPKPRRRRASIASLALTGLMAGCLGLVLLRSRPTGPTLSPRLSLAVLPFTALGGERPYLADAVTDDLTTDLSHIPGSTVIARSSAARFTPRDDSPASIGEALHVRYLLEGSLLDEGARVHVNARLVDASAGTQLWANAFDVARGDTGSILDDIVPRISSALRFSLVQAEETRSQRAPADPDAFDLTIRARSILDHGSDPATLDRARALLERAVGIAPEDSDALAELGLVLVHRMGDFEDRAQSADNAEAVSIIGRAVRLAPESPLAITARGMLSWEAYRCDDAIRSFRTALAFDPNNLDARTGLALCAREAGDMVGMISTFRDILRLDPFGAARAQNENSVGMGYLMLGRPVDAMTWLRRAGAELDPDTSQSGWGWHDWRRLFLIAALQLTGDHDGAARQYASFAADRPYRTAFQLSQYASRAVASLPGYHDFLHALQEAGMPLYPASEDDGVAPSITVRDGGDFDPTPTSIPGGIRIETDTLRMLLASPSPPLLIDISAGASAIPGSAWLPLDATADDCRTLLRRVGAASDNDRPIIVAGTGPFGWQSYDLALSLIGLGYRHVFWFRGGEAAWAASGHATRDYRVL